jgi:hypothetical protein
MVDKPAKCPKGGGIMEEGFPGGSPIGWTKQPWQAQSTVRGRLPATIKSTGGRGLSCKGCGYLELYTKP